MTLALLGIDLEEILRPTGPLGGFAVVVLLAIIFAESGLLIGFFLPGDSLLFVAGLVSASGGLLPIQYLVPLLFVAAVAGDQVGYWFGKRVGPALFRRPDSKIFKQAYVEKAKEFFERHGAKTIILARFVPVVRTFAPILAGVGEMHYRTFVIFNLIGGFIWAVGITLLGFWLGNVSWIKDNIEIAAIAIVALSLIPMFVEFVRHRRERGAGETAEEAAAEVDELHESFGEPPATP